MTHHRRPILPPSGRVWKASGQGCAEAASTFLAGRPLPRPPALVSCFDDLAVMGDAVQERRRHLGVPEDL